MLDIYIFFDGRCAEALRFYEQVLGAKVQALMTYAQSPMPPDPSCGPIDPDHVMHGALSLPDGRTLMASDSPPAMYQQPGGFSLVLQYPTADEARRVFDRLADGGSVRMPLAKAFWAEAFGMCTDRFGKPWMVSGGPLT